MTTRWITGLLCVLAYLTLGGVTALKAETLRIANFHTDLSRDGPGMLLRDLTRSTEPDIKAVIATILASDADIITLQGVDWDFEQRTARALKAQLAQRYPFHFTSKPNAGQPSGLDMDGDGQIGRAGDSLGWGQFSGQNGLLILSQHPIITPQVIDLTPMLWRDLPAHQMPRYDNGLPFPSEAVQYVQPLSSTNHWAVPINIGADSPLWIIAFHATPPVFDGPEDRNGRRNADELRLAQRLIDKVYPAPFVLTGAANLDPHRGDGQHEAITQLLADPRLQDPTPSDTQNQTHTVEWPQTGPMRVDYVLPARSLSVIGAGLLRDTGSRHSLVWVDIMP